MTKQLTTIDPNAVPFQSWVDRTNELIAAANTEFVTANTDANGSVSIGNVYINGIVYSGTLCTSALRGGNVQSTGVLNITSNVSMPTGTILSIGNTTVNVYANSSTIRINGNDIVSVQSQVNVQSTGTLAQIVDSFVKATYRGAEYVISIADNTANNFQFTKVLAFHDSGSDAYMTEFATMSTNTNLGSFSANSNTTHVKLYITPTAANCQIKATRTTVAL